MSRLAPETKNLFPSLPFREIRGMRNIIAHDYGAVNLNRVWETTGDPIDVLIAELSPFLEQQP